MTINQSNSNSSEVEPMISRNWLCTPNSLIILVMAGSEEMGLFKYKRTSSAYKEILCIFSLDWILVTEVLYLIISVKGSFTNANNKGNKERPYFVPSLIEKREDITPLIETNACGAEYSDLLL